MSKYTSILLKCPPGVALVEVEHLRKSSSPAGQVEAEILEQLAHSLKKGDLARLTFAGLQEGGKPLHESVWVEVTGAVYLNRMESSLEHFPRFERLHYCGKVQGDGVKLPALKGGAVVDFQPCHVLNVMPG